MKMAAAEALWDTSSPASFSLFTIGSLDGSQEVWSVRVPKVLSFMATGDPDGTVEGINDVQRASEAQFGPGDYRPNIPVAYWTFRVMIGFGALALLLALAGAWLQRGGRVPATRWFTWAALAGIGFPVVANSVGWIFTEMGRQPWVVYGTLRTADGVSPSVGAASVATSLAVFTLLYGVLAVVEVTLLVRYARKGPDPLPPPDDDEPAEPAPRPLAVAY
jgi:cytochrome bd ubiquinol oxidase subunit I